MGELIFKGIDGAELEAYMLHVRRLALSEGKLRDKEWLLDVVTANLAEDALRWFESLDDEQQNDWTFVKKALYEKYPAPVRCDVSRAGTSAAILPHASPVATSVTTDRDGLRERRGRLKLVTESGNSVYVSLNQKHGLHIATSVPSDQDIFEFHATFIESMRSCHISRKPDSYLGISMPVIRTSATQYNLAFSTHDFMPLLNFCNSASLCTLTTMFPSRVMNSDNNSETKGTTGVWRILESGDIEVWVALMVPDRPMQFLVKGEDIALVSPYGAEQSCVNNGGWAKAKLVLEDL